MQHCRRLSSLAPALQQQLLASNVDLEAQSGHIPKLHCIQASDNVSAALISLPRRLLESQELGLFRFIYQPGTRLLTARSADCEKLLAASDVSQAPLQDAKLQRTASKPLDVICDMWFAHHFMLAVADHVKKLKLLSILRPGDNSSKLRSRIGQNVVIIMTAQAWAPI